MTPQISIFIMSSLEDTDKHIEVTDENYVTEKQIGQVQIRMCDNNENNFIAMLHKVLLAPDLFDGLFSIITLMNQGHTCLFHKGFCTVQICNKKKNEVTLLHSAQRKHAFLIKTKENANSKKVAPKKNLCWNFYTIYWDTDLPDN